MMFEKGGVIDGKKLSDRTPIAIPDPDKEVNFASDPVCQNIAIDLQRYELGRKDMEIARLKNTIQGLMHEISILSQGKKRETSKGWYIHNNSPYPIHFHDIDENGLGVKGLPPGQTYFFK